MLIREVTDRLPPSQISAPEPLPTPQDIDEIEQLIGSIDPKQETAQSLVNKLNTWMKEHPIIDRVTDLIPQTRMVKAVAHAIDALEQGNYKQALNSVAGVVGGTAATLAKGVNVAHALSQNDPLQAVQSLGGNAGKVAKGYNMGQNLASGQSLQDLRRLAGIDAQEPAPITSYDPTTVK